MAADPAGSPWLPPDDHLEDSPLTDPWECAESGCDGVATHVTNGRPTCAEHKEEQ